MSARRPTYRQVALLVFALVLNALTWAQVRAVAVAPGSPDLCIQAHGAVKQHSPAGHGSAIDRDTCLAHCVGQQTPFAGFSAPAILAPSWRVGAIGSVARDDLRIEPRRSPLQPRAPPLS